MPAPNGPSLLLRPAWRPFVLVLPVTAAGPALVALGLWWRAVPVVLTGVWLVANSVRGVLVMRRGRTEAWPDGLYNRLAGRQAEVAWERVDRFVVTPSMFGRVAQVVEQDGARITLAAPRAGLLARCEDFDAELDRLREMARRPPPVDVHSRIFVVAAQVLLFGGVFLFLVLSMVR